MALFALLAIGAASLLAQVTLLREVFALSRGNEVLLGAVMGGWLALTGGFARLGGFLRAKPHRLGLVLAVAPLLLQCSVWLLPVLGRPEDLLPGETQGFIREFLLSLLAILPATAFGGLAYAFAVANAPVAGTGYASENLGAAVAGAAFHFLLASRFGNLTILTVTGVAVGIVAVPFLWRRNRMVALLIPTVSIVLVATFTADNEKQVIDLIVSGEKLVASRPSRFGRLLVVEREGRRVLLQNGVVVAATEDEIQSEEVARLPMLLHPHPQHVLIVGGCLSHAVVEVLAHAPRTVHCLESDEALVSLARSHLAAPVIAALSDPRVTIFPSELRLHARAHPGTYDLILFSVPVPRSPYLARILTVEAFADAGLALRPGGLLALATSGRPSRMDAPMAYRHAMLVATLRAVFPFVSFSPGETTLLWASTRRVAAETQTLLHRLEERRLPENYVGTTWITDHLLPLHVEQYARALAQVQARPNHELRPGMYVAGMVEDLAPSLPWLGAALITWMDTWWLLLLCVLPPVLVGGLSLRRPHVFPPPSFAALTVGAAGMAMSVMSMLWFQVLRGHLYDSMGGILSLFMVGMVVGGLLGKRLVGIRSGLAWACAANGAVAASSIWAVAWARQVPPIAIWILLACAGSVGTATGLAYAPAVAASQSGGSPAARIYALDLLGASFVAIGASWVVLPLLGFPALCLLVTMACSVAALINLRTSSLS